MEPDAVVEADDVVGDVSDCFGVIGIVALPNPFHLQIQEEALHDGVDAQQLSLRLMLATR